MSIIAGATISGKPKNEDAVAVFTNLQAGIQGAIVADGIGSMPYCHLASSFVVNDLKKRFESIEDFSVGILKNNFTECLGAFESYADKIKQEAENFDPEKWMGTTVIACIETKEELIVAYVGNGAAWHIRGDFNHFNKVCTYFPWNAINILNPHTVQDAATNSEAIYRLFFPAAKPEHVRPSIIRIEKEKTPPGDILMVCTDGIFSNDQAIVGKASGILWQKIDQTMDHFFQYLESFIKGGDYQEQNLQQVLNEYLGFLSEKKLLDDDATIGIIFSSESIGFHTEKLQDQTIKNG